MIFIEIDKNSTIPIYQQIVKCIIRLIDDGSVVIGESLPSTRQMARHLGVNRSTIYRSYQELLSLGYIVSVPGSYTRVRKRLKPVAAHGFTKSRLDWSKKSSIRSNLLYKTFVNYTPEFSSPADSNDIINLSQLDLDSNLFPMEDFRRSVNHALISHGHEVMAYGSYFGYPPLREAIANRLRIHGVSVSSDDILITNGAQQAIELILKLLTQPGDRVIIESPTYPNVVPLLRFYQINVQGIPMGELGMDLDRLEAFLKSNSAQFIYTMPNFQNPTGITTTHSQRERLLSLCEYNNTPLVEDGFEEEMKYFGKVVLPVKSMDVQGIVIYIGTFSKVLFPGMRIGWIAADGECIQRLTAIKRFSDITTNQIVQVAIHHFMKMGYYDRNLKRLHRIFRKRMQTAIQAMEDHIPGEVFWTHPAGGYTLWVQVPFDIDESHLKEIMMKYGVMVSPGSYYFSQAMQGIYFRISIADLNEEEIQEGIRRLGVALRSLK